MKRGTFSDYDLYGSTKTILLYYLELIQVSQDTIFSVSLYSGMDTPECTRASIY